MNNYCQSSGILTVGTGIIGRTFQCYSGAREGKNNPALQQIPNVGPIPCGVYDLGELLLESEHGPYAIRLVPRPDNEMFGRAGFLLHGEKRLPPFGEASEGCIILSPQSAREIVYATHEPIEVIQ